MPLVDRLIRRLDAFVGGASAVAAGPDEERVATAALLVHVARIDGSMAAAERVRLLALLRDGFALSAGDADRLILRAEALDREVDDVPALIDMLGRDPDRDRIVAMAYGVAAADGTVAEFEDDLVWRLGRMLGCTDARIASLRAETIDGAAPDPAA